jgi:hypothetical protein
MKKAPTTVEAGIYNSGICNVSTGVGRKSLIQRGLEDV